MEYVGWPPLDEGGCAFCHDIGSVDMAQVPRGWHMSPTRYKCAPVQRGKPDKSSRVQMPVNPDERNSSRTGGA